ITDANGCFIRDSITVVVDMDCPGPPEGLRAAAISATAITLSWNNMSLTQTGLRIERRTASGNFQVIASLSATDDTFTDTSLQPGTLYIYRIKAVKHGTESEPSEEEDETTFSLDQHF